MWSKRSTGRERKIRSYHGSPLDGLCCHIPCPVQILQRCGYGKQRSLQLTAFIGTQVTTRAEPRTQMD